MHDDKRLLRESTAREITTLSRNTLLVHLRFLSEALFRLTLTPAPITYATDGEHLYYGVDHVLKQYVSDKGLVTRAYLHILLHCIFRHAFVGTLVDVEIWDLAADIAAESMLLSLKLSCTVTSLQPQRQQVIDTLQKSVKLLTAEKIYRHYLDNRMSPDQMNKLRALFIADDHYMWYQRKPPDEGDGCPDGAPPDEDSSDDRAAAVSVSVRAELEQNWKDISKRMQTDLETASKEQGDSAGGMVQQLMELNRERYDYAAFLKKFAVMGEIMKVNDDEFDFIFYTYGLKLYGNMPLIEPLEYKEMKRIREFVIAIDTSGSTSGELVQRFMNKTYNILKSTESFFAKIHLHVIQCDADIQESVKITSQDEFDQYLQTMQIKGLGGTDFRPVFSYVDTLIRQHVFFNLKGLVYFTDGYGTFPEKKPEYEAAFVFVRDEFDIPAVPPWAIKLILEKDEL